MDVDDSGADSRDWSIDQEGGSEEKLAVDRVDEAGRDALVEALKVKKAATEMVQIISDSELGELRDLKQWDIQAVKMFEVIALVFVFQKPKRNKDPATNEFDKDGYGLQAKEKLLSDPEGFKTRLVEYDEEDLNKKLLKKVKAALAVDELSAENLKGPGGVLFPLKMWVEALINYTKIKKEVDPDGTMVLEIQA